jgi:hypothetical protein
MALRFGVRFSYIPLMGAAPGGANRPYYIL